MFEFAKTMAGAALGLALGCLALSPLALFQSEETLRVERLANRAPPFSLVIIGSSVVQTHFIPPLFDAEMRARGFDIRSYSLGMGAMNIYEQDHIIGRVLDLELPELRWVFVEISIGDDPLFRHHDNFSNRTLRWHTPRQLGRLYEMYSERDSGLSGLAHDLWPHVKHAAVRAMNVGQGVSLVAHAAWAGAPERETDPVGNTPTEGIWEQRNAEKFRVKHASKWEARVNGLRRRLAKFRKNPRHLPWIDDWAAQVESHGGELVLVRAPGMDPRHTPEQGVRPLDPLPFFDLAQPDAFPELYWVERRLDMQHLTFAGAQDYTRRLAQLFAAHLESVR